MTESTLSSAELLAKAGAGDFLRSVAEVVVQLLMETDVKNAEDRIDVSAGIRHGLGRLQLGLLLRYD